MKDKDRIEQLEGKTDRIFRLLYGDTIDGNGVSVFMQIAALEREVRDLKARDNLVEKDCPVCGHKTLMKRTEARTDYHCAEDGSLDITMTRKPETFYCYSCGKTYREKSETVLEAVDSSRETT